MATDIHIAERLSPTLSLCEEVEAEFDDDVQERYMTGECHALALALHDQTGAPLAAVVVRRGRSKEIAHVMVQVGEDDEWGEQLFLDIRGVRGLPDIFSDLEIDSDEEEATVLAVVAAQVERWAAQPRGGLGRLKEEARADAKTIAARLLEQVRDATTGVGTPAPR